LFLQAKKTGLLSALRDHMKDRLTIFLMKQNRTNLAKVDLNEESN